MATPSGPAGPGRHGGGGRALQRGHRARQVGAGGCGGAARRFSHPTLNRPVSSRMEGQGSYTLPTGTEYRGELRDGMFEGEGELIFPNGGRYRAVWHRGVPVQVPRAGVGGGVGLTPRGLGRPPGGHAAGQVLR